MGFQDNDPGTNFYIENKLYNGLLCNYYSEDSFNDRIVCLNYVPSQMFALCHMNIRSTNSNLSNFKNYLQLLKVNFSVVGVTET